MPIFIINVWMMVTEQNYKQSRLSRLSEYELRVGGELMGQNFRNTF